MIKGKSILIFGYSKSGKSAKELFESKKIDYKIYDKDFNKHQISDNYLNKLNKKTLSTFDLIILSPGVSIYNKYIQIAKKLNIKVISELELGFMFCDAKIIAVTGTNGKTTTVNLIYSILKKAGYSAQMFGNMGNAFSGIIKHKNLDYAIVEVSSFHLESLHDFKPDIGVILNIDKDHIDRHKNFETYLKCKLDLFKQNKNDGIAVLNADDKFLLENLNSINAHKKVFFSTEKPVDGVYLLTDSVFSNLNKKEEFLFNYCELEKVKTFEHNILAVLAVASVLGIDLSLSIEAITEFQWLESRIEIVGKINETEFINDSKATNIHATISAVKSIKNPIHLLVGGKDKGIPFSDLFKNLPNNIKGIYCFGESQNKLYKSAKKAFKKTKTMPIIYKCSLLESAVNRAYNNAEKGDVVLLSPACSSLDYYKSYTERGEHFKSIVKDISLNTFGDKKTCGESKV